MRPAPTATTSTAQTPALQRPFDSLWQQRELFWQFTLRNIQIRHRGSTLGFLWAAINPLLLLAVYTFVFGIIFGGRFGVREDETPWSYAMGIFLGLTLFNLLAETLATAPSLIVNNPNYVKKVVFPLAILPASAVAASFYHFLISLSLCLLGIVVFTGTWHPGFLYLPIIIAPVALMALGISWFFSAVCVFLRDLAQLSHFLTLIMMYASAIFYSVKKVKTLGPEYWIFLKYNPLVHAIDQARRVTLWDLPIQWPEILFLWTCSLLLCLAGYWTFQRLRPAFADVV